MNATSQTLAVVKARLPYTDRGSFSQAWFSALHLAARAPQGSAAARVHRPLDAGARVASDARAAAAPAERRSATGAVSARAFSRGGLRVPLPVETARAQTRVRTALPVTGARAARPAIAPLRATLSIGDGGARVQLLLRHEGETLYVVALCSARNVELVRRALAAAQTALHARGRRIDAAVRALESEEGS